MSRSVEFVVSCDHGDCTQHVSAGTDAGAVVFARAKGWQLGERDLCPEHAAVKAEAAAR